MATLRENMESIKLEKETKILPENLRAGITAFGVEGTLKEGSADIPVKLFKTEEEMQADETAKEGDLAVVYADVLTSITENDNLGGKEIIFPTTLKLSTPITSTYNTTYYEYGTSYITYTVSANKTSFSLSNSDANGLKVAYTSTDGINYVKYMGPDKYIPTTTYAGVDGDDILLQFFNVTSYAFEGLYSYGNRQDTSVIDAYINPNMTTDKKFKYDSLTSIDVNTLVGIKNLITNKSDYTIDKWDRYLLVKKSDTIFNCYMCKEGDNRWGPASIYNNGTNRYICASYSLDGADLFRKLTIDLASKTLTETEMAATVYDYQKVCETFDKTDIVTNIWLSNIPNISSYAGTLEVFGKNSGTTTSNTNRTSFNIVCPTSTKYHYAPSQLQDIYSCDIIGDKTVYANNGLITGDGTAYNTLDDRKLIAKVYGDEHIIQNEEDKCTIHKSAERNLLLLDYDKFKDTRYIIPVKVSDYSTDLGYGGIFCEKIILESLKYYTTDFTKILTVDSSAYTFQLLDAETNDLLGTYIIPGFTGSISYTNANVDDEHLVLIIRNNNGLYYGTISLTDYSINGVMYKYDHKYYAVCPIGTVNEEIVTVIHMSDSTDTANKKIIWRIQAYNYKTNTIRTIRDIIFENVSNTNDYSTGGLTTSNEIIIDSTISGTRQAYRVSMNGDILASNNTNTTASLLSCSMGMSSFGVWYDDGEYIYRNKYRYNKSTMELTTDSTYSDKYISSLSYDRTICTIGNTRRDTNTMEVLFEIGDNLVDSMRIASNSSSSISCWPVKTNKKLISSTTYYGKALSIEPCDMDECTHILVLATAFNTGTENRNSGQYFMFNKEAFSSSIGLDDE